MQPTWWNHCLSSAHSPWPVVAPGCCHRVPETALFFLYQEENHKAIKIQNHMWGITWVNKLTHINKLRPRQNGRHFSDNIFKGIFLNENVCISIKIPLKFAPKGPINNIPTLVQIMAWCWSGDKPLSEPMIVRLLTHISITPYIHHSASMS